MVGFESDQTQIGKSFSFNSMFNIGMFDNTTKGIFALLNDECTLPKSSSEKFTYNVCKTWIGHKSFSAPNCSARNRSQQATESFKIRHFSGDVLYSTVCNWNYLSLSCPLSKLFLILDWFRRKKSWQNYRISREVGSRQCWNAWRSKWRKRKHNF